MAGVVKARAFLHALPVLALVAVLPACELQQVTLAPSDDVVVVEAYLRTDQARQIVLLHRTLQGDLSLPVDATVTVTGPDRVEHPFTPTAIDACVEGPQHDGTCYASGDATDPFRPVAGGRYHLAVQTADGRSIVGETVVPGAYDIMRPRSFPCTMPAGEPLDLVWTVSDGAWVYLVDAALEGLRDALAPRGIVVEEDPFRLSGLSISKEDTTITFPTELGVFDRNNLSRELLLELQKGLPDGVEARITVSAADANYTNWARRGSFNPSGLIRVSSVAGDGVGVFGSLNVREFVVSSTADPWPVCR